MAHTSAILNLFGVNDSRLLPEAIMAAVMNPNEEERKAVYLSFLELHRNPEGKIDLSRDLLAAIYEQELSERKEKKQDFTPPQLSTLAAQLTMTGGKVGSCHEPTAGNGGMLIAYWHETLMNSHSILGYRPSNYPIEAWELSDRSVPILLLNLSLRGMEGMVINGDVLEQKAEAIYLLENPTDSPFSFSTIRKITRENFAAFAKEQVEIKAKQRK